jgi:beta-lactamase class A
LIIAVSALAAVFVPSFLFAKASARYDVLYLKSADLREVILRRKAIVETLGPKLAEKLRAVHLEDGYAVIYMRHGDAQAAAATAAAHTRILRARGLGEAVSIATRPWEQARKSEERAEKEPPSSPKTVQKAAPIPQAQAAVQQIVNVRAEERRRLEELVDGHLKQLRRQGRIASDERTAWSVYDFTTGEKLVDINADIRLQAASLIKPFLALAFMHQVGAGRLEYDAASRAQMERMIQHSDNASTNWVMRRLGGPAAAAALLRKNYGDILQDVELVEYIPPGGRTYRNKASVSDYSRFLFALWKDKLSGSAEIKRLMALPKRDRLHTGADVPEDTEVYSKTGTTRRLCGDMGVLSAKGPDGKQYAYTVIGIIEKKHPARHYLRWMKSRGDVIREISGLVYHAIGALHGFAPTP